MAVTPCKKNPELKKRIEEFAEILKSNAHQLSDYGLSESDFYNSGLFRGAIERIRGQLIVWSVSTNQGGDPRRNVWSGLHTRLSAEMISNNKQVDGLIVWDWVCGTLGRRCPKLDIDPSRKTVIGQFELPPPCIYVFPSTIPEVRNNPAPKAQSLKNVEILDAFHSCFKGRGDEVNSVDFEVAHQGADTVRKTVVRRAGVVVQKSDFTPIQRR